MTEEMTTDHIQVEAKAPEARILTANEMELMNAGRMAMIKENHLTFIVKMLAAMPGQRFEFLGSDQGAKYEFAADFMPEENKVVFSLKSPPVIITPDDKGNFPQ